MKMSDLRREYCSFYQQHKGIRLSEKSFIRGGVAGVAEIHHGAERTYRKFKSGIEAMSQLHPQQAVALQKILSNARILRHRQKLSERNLFTVQGDRALIELVGKSEKVNQWQRVMNEDLQLPLALLEKSKQQYERDHVDVMRFDNEFSKEVYSLKERGEALKDFAQQITIKHQELSWLVAGTVKAYREASDPSEEKRSLEKLDRIRVKIARFKSLWLSRL